MTVTSDRPLALAAAGRRPARPSVDAGRHTTVTGSTAGPLAARARPQTDGEGPSPALLARTVMGWHLPELTETEVMQAVVATVPVLVPGAVGAAVLSQPRTRSGLLQVLAVAGTLPVPSRTVEQGTVRPDPYVAADVLERRSSGRELHGWSITTTPAPAGEGTLIRVPLSRGTKYDTLLIVMPTAVTDRAAENAVVMTMHAATAISAARERVHLRIAVNTRDVIGQAKGILMERLHLTAAAAFELLSRASQDNNLKLADVCAGVCATGDLGSVGSASSRR